MAKVSQIDRAIADVDAKLDVLRQVREALLATKQAHATVMPRKKKAKALIGGPLGELRNAT